MCREKLLWLERAGAERQGNEADQRYVIYMGAERQVLAQFRIQPLPGCCGSAVLSYRYINSYLNKRINKAEIQLALAKMVLTIQEEACKDARFTNLLATCTEQSPENALYKPTWKNIESYTNKKTGNKVNVWSKILEHTPDPVKTPRFGEGA
jgi:hypothetical protein